MRTARREAAAGQNLGGLAEFRHEWPPGKCSHFSEVLETACHAAPTLSSTASLIEIAWNNDGAACLVEPKQ